MYVKIIFNSRWLYLKKTSEYSCPDTFNLLYVCNKLGINQSWCIQYCVHDTILNRELDKKQSYLTDLEGANIN